MTIIYAFVCRAPPPGIADPHVRLAEHTAFSGDFKSVAFECLEKVPSRNDRFTFNIGGHTFNFLVNDRIVYGVVAHENDGKALPFGFLEKVKEDFLTKHAGVALEAAEGSLDRKFGPKLQQWMQYCDANPSEFNKVAQVQQRIQEVKDIVITNIDKVLERGERIDTLEEKTDNLKFHANQFQRKGQDLRRRLWWDNMKMKAIFAGVILLVILVLVLIICGVANCW
uniref:Vesicle-associated membrane protein 7 n=1 Tax=Tetraselmis sp. GSL018 TaxID=582737 RepID=A0A061S5R3_9CHLO|mmetsp:Transcript_42416/g.100668  ORF Transcript_42416/g.100668 Transcript_42416/m.100668 type:complete len:225 (+) Transcript_42416:84-758(+)